MDEFKGIIKKRLAFMGGLNVFAIAFIVLSSRYKSITASGNENIADMIRGFQVGIFIGPQMMMLLAISKYTKALKNDNVLRKLYIAEKDERSRLIKDKIGGVGFNFALGVIVTATVIAGFFHQLVFLTLLVVVSFMSLVKGTLKLYYRTKF